MALTDYVIMPGADYQALCDKIREKTGKTGAIKSGDLVAEVEEAAGTLIGDTEEVTVDLSMADGDQVIEPSAYGKVLTKVTVKKPETLLPENIAKDINIGGVVGEHSGGGDLEGDILKYIAYQIDFGCNELIVCAIFFELLYQDTGSYAIHIPEKIGDYRVVINSEGVT